LPEGRIKAKMNASDRSAILKGGITDETDGARDKKRFELGKLKCCCSDGPQFAPEFKNE
jgi:hypothetical protein